MITSSFQHFQLLGNTPANLTKGKGAVPGMITGTGKSFNSLFGKMLAQKDGAELSLLEKKVLDLKTATGETGESAIEALLANLQLDGQNPEEVGVDSKGLKIIEQLLEHLGFGEEEVDNFIADITNGGEKSKLSLSGFLTKLSNFLESAKKEEKFAMSALPAIESLLSAMGVNPSEIETLLYNAGNDEGGVDLQKLISGLKSTLANQTGKQTGGELELNAGNQLILSGLGLSAPGKKTLTLEEFIEKIEAMVKGKGGALEKDETVTDIAKRFGEHLHSGLSRKTIHSGQRKNQNSLADNHAFQKQQQVLEDNVNLEASNLKIVDQLKSGQAKFIIKDGMVLMNDHEAQSGLVKKNDDSGMSSVKAGVTADSLAHKKTESAFRMPSNKTLPSYVTNQVSMKIANAAKNGETVFKIHIKPPEMGRLQISIDFTNNGLKVGILAEHTATRDMLLSNSSELKSILADQGIRLDKVQVDVSGDFQQSMTDAGNESGNSGKKQGKREGQNFFEQVTGSRPVGFTNDPYLRPDIGRLSLVV